MGEVIKDLRRFASSSPGILGANAQEDNNSHIINGNAKNEHTENCLESWLQLNKKVREFIDNPASSRGAFIFSAILAATIIISCVLLCFGTMEEFNEYKSMWREVEITVNVLFSIEFFVRILVARSLVDPYLFIDFTSILPFFIALLTEHKSNWMKLLMSLKMIRLMKLARQYSGATILAKALFISIDALMVPMFFLLVMVTVFASIIYYAESLEMGGNSAFDSVPQTMWFMLVTITTVGYGDIYPESVTGKWLTAFAMIFGIIFLSMPLAIVGDNFVHVWEEKEKVIYIEYLRSHLRKGLMKVDSTNIHDAFREIAEKNSNKITFEDFHAYMLKLNNSKFNSKGVYALWRQLDTNNSGSLEFDEFLALFSEDVNIVNDVKTLSFLNRSKSTHHVSSFKKSFSDKNDIGKLEVRLASLEHKLGDIHEILTRMDRNINGEHIREDCL